MRKTIALAVTSAVIVFGGAAIVVAQTTSSVPTCADIIAGEGIYSPAQRETNNLEVEKAITRPGHLNFTLFVGTQTGDEPPTPAASCPDVTYGIQVYDDATTSTTNMPGHEIDFATTPRLLATSSIPGDGVSSALTFDLDVADDDNSVCVVVTTAGITQQSSTSSPTKGGPPSRTSSTVVSQTLFDRAPDAGDPEGYCIPEGGNDPARSYR